MEDSFYQKARGEAGAKPSIGETRGRTHTKLSNSIASTPVIEGRTFKVRKLPTHDVPHGWGILFGVLREPQVAEQRP
jgi:hypothetical protein